MASSSARWRVVLKLIVVVLGVVGAGLGVLGWTQSTKEVHAVRARARDIADYMVGFTIAGVEHAMLQGNGITVKDLVSRFKARVPGTDIHIYDEQGHEVFGEKPPAPPRTSLPPILANVLDGGGRIADDAGHVFRAIPNEKRCHQCHDAAKPVRGVLEFRIGGALGATNRASVLPGLIRAGFTKVMTSKQAHLLDDYMNEIHTRAPTIGAIGIYGNDGHLRFGVDVPGVTEDVLKPSLQPGAGDRRVQEPTGGGEVVLVSLPREERCGQCHQDTNPVRGVLAVTLMPVDSDVTALEEFEVVVDSSLRVIMMSSLGRMITRFLDEVRATGAVSDAKLYDDAGRLYYTSDPATPPANIKAVLDKGEGQIVEEQIGTTGERRLLIGRLLTNEGRCTTCHGTSSKIRGVVTVSLGQPKPSAMQAAALRRTTLFTAVTLAGIALVLTPIVGWLTFRPRRRADHRPPNTRRGDRPPGGSGGPSGAQQPTNPPANRPRTPR